MTVIPPPTAPPMGGTGGAAGASQAGAGAGGQAGLGGAGSTASAGGAGSGGSLAVAGGGAGGASGAGAGGGGGTGGGGASGSAAPATGDICERWAADRTNLSEGTWSGDADACEAGDMTPEARTTAHRLVNLYRSMAGQSPIEMTDEGNRLAQACALLMTANGSITHTPPASWSCYTEEAADTAGSSSLSGGGSVSSVDGYMIDPGNPTTLGHRRWVLSSMLASIGFGSTGVFSCQYQPPRRPPADAKPWVAWPPPGQVPVQALGGRWASVDETGWSVQSDGINLGSADVTVTSDGMDLPVSVTALNPGYGSSQAIRFNPMGWTSAAGKTYHVAISGVSPAIEYDVEVVDCP